MQIYLFDIDGVLIRLPKFFSQHLEENGYPGIASVIGEFYSGPHILCDEGKKEPLTSIKPYVKRTAWKGTTDEFLKCQYEFERQFVDHELLDLIQEKRKAGDLFYLASDQNNHRKEYLLNDLKFKDYFDGWFISSEIGWRKEQPGYWEYLIQNLNKQHCLENENIIYFDDMIHNINTAKKFGINAIHVTGEENIIWIMSLLKKVKF